MQNKKDVKMKLSLSKFFSAVSILAAIISISNVSAADVLHIEVSQVVCDQGEAKRGSVSDDVSVSLEQIHQMSLSKESEKSEYLTEAARKKVYWAATCITNRGFLGNGSPAPDYCICSGRTACVNCTSATCSRWE